MLEVYQAYSDHRGMMDLVRDLVRTLARDVLDTLDLEQPDGTVIQFGDEWKEVTYAS